MDKGKKRRLITRLKEEWFMFSDSNGSSKKK